MWIINGYGEEWRMQEFSKGGFPAQGARHFSIRDLRQFLAVERVAYSSASLAELCREDVAPRGYSNAPCVAGKGC